MLAWLELYGCEAFVNRCFTCQVKDCSNQKSQQKNDDSHLKFVP